MSPLLSVIIPVFNSEKFLPKAIESVLKTSIKEIEIIVVDDASLGNCKDLVGCLWKSDSRIKYVRHPFNKGLLASRFTGVFYAKGEYIAHLDADDEVVDDIYAKAYDYAKLMSLDVVYFNTLQCDTQGKRWNDSHNTFTTLNCLKGDQVLDNIFSSQGRLWVWHVSWNKIIKREVMQSAIRRFDKIPHVIMCEDLLWSVALHIELINSPTISTMEEIGIFYLRHNQSITKRIDNEAKFKKLEDLLITFRLIENTLKKSELWRKYQEDFLKLRVVLLKIHCFKINLWVFLRNLPFIAKFFLLNYRCFYILITSCTNDITSAADILVNKAMDEKINAFAIFGTGELALEVRRLLKERNISVKCFISSDKFSIGTTLQETPIVSIGDALEAGEENIIIASIGSGDIIKNTLMSHKRELNAIAINPLGSERYKTF